jgi:CxxC motif-containing protein (DUF1111 family)
MLGGGFGRRPGGVLALLILVLCTACTQRDVADQTLRNQYPGTPIATLTAEQTQRFEAGLALFSKQWGPHDGLGPTFNSTACANCHHLPLPGGNEISLTAFMAHSPGCKDAVGTDTCARFLLGRDGELTPLQLPANASLRKPQSLYGLGMLEAVSDADLRAAERRQRDDPDRVGGRVGRTRDGRVGRFGWEAQFATIEDFTAGALILEFGLRNGKYLNDGSGARHPEVEQRIVDALSDFVRMLAAPPLTDRGDVTRGRATFDELRCSACHQPALYATAGKVKQIQGLTFYAYTDLLLHDVGTGKNGTWLRTPPLWGLNASGPPYLHDASALSVDEAIVRHGGQAKAAAARYRNLGSAARQELLRFLDSI